MSLFDYALALLEEALGRPPRISRSLFERGDAEYPIKGAGRVFGLVEGLLNEWRGRGAPEAKA